MSIRSDSDWNVARAVAADTLRAMSDAVVVARERQKKISYGVHFMTEIRLVNHVACGQFDNVNRDDLSTDQLNLIAMLQRINGMLIERGLPYSSRKATLERISGDPGEFALSLFLQCLREPGLCSWSTQT